MRFDGRSAVVVGDVMIDEYLFGHATRISPEAPVMVIHHDRSMKLLGGAANVARNLAALGAKVSLIGVTGQDNDGHELSELLKAEKITFKRIFDPSRKTTRKTRVIADHSHQVLRIDSEDSHAVSGALQHDLIDGVRQFAGKSDVIVLSDYLKGTLSEAVAQAAIQEGKQLSIPVLANPKPRSLKHYAGADLVTLNRAEAAHALGELALADADAPAAAAKLKETLGARAVLVTLGGSGMVCASDQSFSIAAPRVEVADPAGAGDTVIASCALGASVLGVSDPLVYETAARLAAIVVQRVGVAVPTPSDIASI